MSKKTFYDFKGEPIGVKEFIELYEPCYFIQSDNKKDEEIQCIRTSRYVEVEEIETICEDGIYAKYIEKLDALGVDYKEDRRLDRALWVYGHAFKAKEGKCC